MALNVTFLHRLETGKCDGVMRMLLKECGDKSRGIEACFHHSKAPDFCASLVPLLIDKCSDIPDAGRNFAGAYEDAIFFSER